MASKAKDISVVTLKVKDVEKEWFTSSEACKYLGVSRRTFQNWRVSGKLKFYSLEPDNIHSRTFVNKRDMDRLFKPVTL